MGGLPHLRLLPPAGVRLPQPRGPPLPPGAGGAGRAAGGREAVGRYQGQQGPPGQGRHGLPRAQETGGLDVGLPGWDLTSAIL